MPQQLEDTFSQVVPGAASRAEQFLGVVQKQCQEFGLGLDLQPVKPNRREERIVLRGAINIQASRFKGKGRPVSLEVHADPVGASSALSVGWQLLSQQTDFGIMRYSNFAQHMNQGLDRSDNDPNRVRQITAQLQAFHQTVFLPVMQQLSDAVQREMATQGQSGFFGAS